MINRLRVDPVHGHQNGLSANGLDIIRVAVIHPTRNDRCLKKRGFLGEAGQNVFGYRHEAAITIVDHFVVKLSRNAHRLDQDVHLAGTKGLARFPRRHLADEFKITALPIHSLEQQVRKVPLARTNIADVDA